METIDNVNTADGKENDNKSVSAEGQLVQENDTSTHLTSQANQPTIQNTEINQQDFMNKVVILNKSVETSFTLMTEQQGMIREFQGITRDFKDLTNCFKTMINSFQSMVKDDLEFIFERQEKFNAMSHTIFYNLESQSVLINLVIGRLYQDPSYSHIFQLLLAVALLILFSQQEQFVFNPTKTK